jgi:hypothetical protein
LEYFGSRKICHSDRNLSPEFQITLKENKRLLQFLKIVAAILQITFAVYLCIKIKELLKQVQLYYIHILMM